MLGLIEDLNIDSNNESSSSEHQNRNSNSDLLDELMKNEMFKRKKGQWFNSKQIDELSKLLSKYPENHKSIWNFFRISKSSYQRIIKERPSVNLNQRNARRKTREVQMIPLAEQIHIAKIIEPPAQPISIKEI